MIHCDVKHGGQRHDKCIGDGKNAFGDKEHSVSEHGGGRTLEEVDDENRSKAGNEARRDMLVHIIHDNRAKER